MEKFVTKQNLVIAGSAVVAVYAGQALTAGKGTWVQGLTSFGLALLVVPFAMKHV